jgi:hypothetical protein
MKAFERLRRVHRHFWRTVFAIERRITGIPRLKQFDRSLRQGVYARRERQP